MRQQQITLLSRFILGRQKEFFELMSNDLHSQDHFAPRMNVPLVK